MHLVLTPELLLEAYRHGLFPMAYSADSPYIQWVCPEMRGQLSIEALHIPRSLKKSVRRYAYDVKINTDFERVIRACGEATSERPETWINDDIIKTFIDLHMQGHAHSVEVWRNQTLVGGLYGLAIGGAFFGESMFSRTRDTSKIALVHLVARLWRGGFQILDTQFVNTHLQQFGVYEIAHEDYMRTLEPVLEIETDFQLGGVRESTLIEEYFAFRA